MRRAVPPLPNTLPLSSLCPAATHTTVTIIRYCM